MARHIWHNAFTTSAAGLWLWGALWGIAPSAQAEPNLPQQLFEHLSRQAANGEVTSQYRLGCAYREGLCQRVEPQKALALFCQAAEQGNAAAQREVGKCYLTGNGVRFDYYEAFTRFYKAAHAGDSEAAYYLARCYHDGIGTVKSASEAKQWYTVAGKSGYVPDTLNFIGHEYFGIDVAPFSEAERVDFAREAKYQLAQGIGAGRALDCYKLATLYRQGITGHREPDKAKALYQLAYLMWTGKVVGTDVAKAVTIVEQNRAVSIDSNDIALRFEQNRLTIPAGQLPTSFRYNLGHYYYSPHSPLWSTEPALSVDAANTMHPDAKLYSQYLNEAAAQGYLPAILDLGTGRVATLPDSHTSEHTYCEQAATSGSPVAMRLLAASITPGNDAKAVEYYLKLSESGDCSAMLLWVENYLANPTSPYYDSQSALHWLSCAANLGDWRACTKLSQIYDKGYLGTQKRSEQLVSPNQTTSLRWLELASKCYFGSQPREVSSLTLLTQLANRYAFGRGCSPDLHKAAKLYRTVVQRGHDDEATYRLAILLLDGQGDVADKHAARLEGKELLEKLSEDASSPYAKPAQTRLARHNQAK